MVATRSEGPVEPVKKAEGANAMLLINILTYACGELEVGGEVVQLTRPHCKGMAMGWALSFTKESLSDEWLSHEAAIDITVEGLKAVFLADGRRASNERVLNRVKRPQEELEDVVLSILWEKRREEVFNDDDLRKAFVDAVNGQAAWKHFVRVSREHILETRRRKCGSKGHGTRSGAWGRSRGADHEGGGGGAWEGIKSERGGTGGALECCGGGGGGGHEEEEKDDGGGGDGNRSAAASATDVDTSDLGGGPEIIVIDDEDDEDDGSGGGGWDGAYGVNDYEHSQYLGDDDQPPTLDDPAASVLGEAEDHRESGEGRLVMSDGEEGGPEGRKEGSGGRQGGDEHLAFEMRGEQGGECVDASPCESRDTRASGGAIDDDDGRGGDRVAGGGGGAGSRAHLSAGAISDTPPNRECYGCVNTSHAVSGSQAHEGSEGVRIGHGSGAVDDGRIVLSDKDTPRVTSVLQKCEHTESSPEAAAPYGHPRQPSEHQGEKGKFHVKEEGGEPEEEPDEPAGKRRRVSIEVKPAVVREDVMNAVKAKLFGMLKEATRNNDAKAAILKATYLAITTGKVAGSLEVMAELCQLSDSIDVSDHVSVHVAADLLVGIIELVS